MVNKNHSCSNSHTHDSSNDKEKLVRSYKRLHKQIQHKAYIRPQHASNRGDLPGQRAKPSKVYVELRQPRLVYALATIAIEETSHAPIAKPSKVQAELRQPRLTHTLATIAVEETSYA